MLLKRNPHRVSTDDYYFNANTSRPDRFVFESRHDDSLRASASYTTLGCAHLGRNISPFISSVVLYLRRFQTNVVSSPSASAAACSPAAFVLLATRANFPMCQLITLTLRSACSRKAAFAVPSRCPLCDDPSRRRAQLASNHPNTTKTVVNMVSQRCLSPKPMHGEQVCLPQAL